MVSSRWASPVRALTVAYAIAIVAFLAQPPAQFMGTVLNMGLLLAITVVTLAALKVPERHPHIYAASSADLSVARLRVACWAVIVMNTLIFLLLAAAVPLALGLLALVLGAAALYWRRQRSARASDLAHPGAARPPEPGRADA